NDAATGEHLVCPGGPIDIAGRFRLRHAGHVVNAGRRSTSTDVIKSGKDTTCKATSWVQNARPRQWLCFCGDKHQLVLAQIDVDRLWLAWHANAIYPHASRPQRAPQLDDPPA